MLQGRKCVIVNATSRGFDFHSRNLNIEIKFIFTFFSLVSRQSVALSFTTPHAISLEFAGKLRTATGCEKYSVKQKNCFRGNLLQYKKKSKLILDIYT